jgi:P27 family predicted phage terminase small subunit
MPVGRPAIPTEIKKLRGNPGKRPLNQLEPKPKTGIPRMPAWLTEAAKEEWEHILPILSEMRVLTKADRAPLAGYCQQFARWAQAEAEIDADGQVIRVPIVSKKTGEVVGHEIKANPAVAIADTASRSMRNFAIDLGLTPASRTKLHMIPEGENNPDEKTYFA